MEWGCDGGSCRLREGIWTGTPVVGIVVERCVAPNGGGVNEYGANEKQPM